MPFHRCDKSCIVGMLALYLVLSHQLTSQGKYAAFVAQQCEQVETEVDRSINFCRGHA
jgi:hypothetical protein